MNDGKDSAERLAELTGEMETIGARALIENEIENARAIFRELLRVAPDNIIANYGMGVISQHDGDDGLAERHLRNAVRQSPDWAEPHKALGKLLLKQGRHNRAVRALEKAVALEPGDVDGRYAYASALQAQGRTDASEQQLLDVIKREPAHSRANNDLGCIAIMRGMPDAAEAYFRKALDSADTLPSDAINLGNLLLLQNRIDDAHAMFENALEQDPTNVEAMIGAASADRRANRLEQALLRAEQAASLSPENIAAINLVGSVYQELGDYATALERYEAALVLNARDPAARANLGMLQLLNGDWAAGWRNYEARRADPSYKNPFRGVTAPRWQGNDLNGARIIVLAEQGFGDSIQFARYLPALAKLGAEVMFAVQPELFRLFDGFTPDVSIIRLNEPLDAIQFQTSLMDLPGLLGINTPETVEGSSYLTPPALSDKLASKLSGIDGLKIGVNWRGSVGHKSDSKRSMSPDLLNDLTQIPRTSWISLGFGSQSGTTPKGLIDVSADIDDFADTAALMAHLDLVISVDTATVHLAGAIGTPCWAMIPFVPDWRWLRDGAQTVWYDSVRLFRQPERGDWQSVVSNVRTALDEKLN